MVSVPILLGITVIVFFIASKMPGDAVLAMVSTDSPQAEDLIQPRRGQLGLDQPLHEQYGRWLWQLLHGNLGYSFQSGEPVHQVIAARLPATLQLMGVALAIAIAIGASVLEVMNNDYVRTTRAKGLRETLITTRHILRNALIPVVTVIGLSLPVLFGGAVIY